MENETAIKPETEGSGDKSREYGQSDREPKQFVRVGTSRDGKWVFIDIVTRAFVHINYLRAIDRNKLAELAKAGAGMDSDAELAHPAPEPSAGVAEKPARKSKGAGQPNARAT